MRRTFVIAATAIISLVFHAGIASAEYAYPLHPPGAGLVNDFAGVLDGGDRARLEVRLRDLESRTKAEVAVVTVKSLDGQAVAAYANGLFRAWGIGKKGMDNGVLLLVAPSEHKTRIEVGRRFEPFLTDAAATEIIQTKMLPAFRTGDFLKGIVAGTDAIINVVGNISPDEERLIGEHAEPNGNEPSHVGFFLGMIVCIFLVTMFALWLWSPETESPDPLYRDYDAPPRSRGRSSSRSDTGSRRSRRRDDDSSSSGGWSSGSSSGSDSSSNDSGSSGFGFGGGDSGGGGADGSW